MTKVFFKCGLILTIMETQTFHTRINFHLKRIYTGMRIAEMKVDNGLILKNSFLIKSI